MIIGEGGRRLEDLVLVGHREYQLGGGGDRFGGLNKFRQCLGDLSDLRVAVGLQNGLAPVGGGSRSRGRRRIIADWILMKCLIKSMKWQLLMATVNSGGFIIK